MQHADAVPGRLLDGLDRRRPDPLQRPDPALEAQPPVPFAAEPLQDGGAGALHLPTVRVPALGDPLRQAVRGEEQADLRPSRVGPGLLDQLGMGGDQARAADASSTPPDRSGPPTAAHSASDDLVVVVENCG